MANVKTSMLREQVKRAGGVLEGVMKGVTEEMAHWQPGGTANSIAANAAHVITAVDGVVNGMLKGEAPIGMSMSTGMNEPPPMDENRFNWHDWGTRVRLNLSEFHEYAEKVLASVDDYLENLSDEVLDKNVQTPVGERSIFDMLNGAVLSNLNWHTGEISSLKGQKGQKGYEF